MDEGSRLKRENAIEAAQRADSIIYSIYYVDRAAYFGRGISIGRSGDGDLRKMSEDTGGRILAVDRKRTLNDIFNQIQEEMRSQYSIGFTSTNERKDGSFRRLEIRTNDKTMKVQTRKGYYATPAEAK